MCSAGLRQWARDREKAPFPQHLLNGFYQLSERTLVQISCLAGKQTNIFRIDDAVEGGETQDLHFGPGCVCVWAGPCVEGGQ